jgi:TPR repeat protein
MLVGAALALGSVCPVLGQEAVDTCSSLAASPYDPNLEEGAGLLIEDIDTEPAIAACTAAVAESNGDPRMHFQLARAFDAAERYDEAIEHYQIAIDGDYAMASVGLGFLYELGQGVEVDEAEAVRLYQAAYDAGDRGAAPANLAYVYDNGIGVAEDDAIAARYYQEASDAGISWAMTSLGWFYENGMGVEEDYARAVELYQKASDLGDAEAANNLGVAYEDGVGGLTKSIELALEHYELGAERGSALALTNLGNLYVNGRELPVDRDRGLAYFEAALESDDANAVARAQNGLAWEYALANERLEEAETLATGAVDYDPEVADYLDTLGWIKHLRGDDDSARELLAKSSELDPSIIHFAHLGDVQAALGDVEGARASYEAALALDVSDFEDPTVDLEAIRAWLAAN